MCYYKHKPQMKPTFLHGNYIYTITNKKVLQPKYLSLFKNLTFYLFLVQSRCLIDWLIELYTLPNYKSLTASKDQLQRGHSNHERFGFILPLFCLYFVFIFTYFVLISELANHSPDSKQWPRHFFYLFLRFCSGRTKL